ncbi:MAG: class I SAM-dependent methyltransferase, partial [Bacteroidota bacterium]
YSEMTEKMITICQENHDKKSFLPLEILEFGAGTGIFTMKLANGLSKTLRKLDAIEFDWHCYKILNIKTREFSNSNPTVEVNVYHEDSRTYDPPGKFDYIFSTFADHHIKKNDKELYFENVKKNLKSGGLMIIGDEFIREHNPNNKEEKHQALKEYHNHIIDIAKQEGHDILAELEHQALVSGLEEKGDFKLSCSQYEKFLQDAGFKFKKEKIGPLDRDDIGGIYVYTAWLK